MSFNTIVEQREWVKKKWRWTFQGFNENGEVVFPECFVKSNRPNFPYTAIADDNGGRFELLPGEICIYQFFTMYDHAGEARIDFNKFDGKNEGVTSACLMLRDGCGIAIEKWDFYNVEMTLCPESEIEDDDNIVVKWLVSYKCSDWKLCEHPDNEGWLRIDEE